MKTSYKTPMPSVLLTKQRSCSRGEFSRATVSIVGGEEHSKQTREPMRMHKLYAAGVAAAVALYAHSVSAAPEWLELSGHCAQSIAASPAGVWVAGCNGGIGNNSAVYWLNPSSTFQRVTSSFAVATQVGVSLNGNVWVINQAGGIGQVVSPEANGTSGIVPLPSGVATQNGIGVNPNNTIFVRGTDQNPWQWNGSVWTQLPSPGGLVNWISVFNTGSASALVVTTESGSFWEAFIFWTQLSGAEGTLLADHMTLAGGKIFFYNDSTNVWTQDTINLPVAPSNVRGIAYSYNPNVQGGIPYLIDTSGNIWQEYNNGQ